MILSKDRLFFSKKNRLLGPDDFQRVFKKGRKRKKGVFTLICVKNDQACARLGLAIAKRYVPLAVSRNRIRRIIRESFRLYQEKLAGMDIVVLVQKNMSEWKDSCLHEDLHQQWQYLFASLKNSA